MPGDKDVPNDDTWCGTWRPTRPRGPISAQHKSPGPKYLLPGLTGAHQHDPTKYRAPMYSFGTYHNVVTTDCSPGPKYSYPCNMTRYGRDGTPAFSIHGRPKQPQPFQVPGPDYCYSEHSQKLLYPSTPAYSLSGRNKDTEKSLTPGPTTYNLPSLMGSQIATAPSAPSYTLSGRNKGTFHEDNKNTPGPAAYNAADPSLFGPRPPQFSIAGRHFPSDGKKNTPGPGAYSPEKEKAKAPGFSFGIRHSQYTLPLITKDFD